MLSSLRHAGRRLGGNVALDQRRRFLLNPAVAINNTKKMLSTYTMRSAMMSSHMHVTVLFSVKAAATVVVSPTRATLWQFVTDGNGIAPRYTSITTALMLPMTRAASMTGGTVVVIFVSQVFCVVTVLTGVGCVQLTQMASAWQRRAIQVRNGVYSIKPYMITGVVVLRSKELQPCQRVNNIGTYQRGPDAKSASLTAIYRKTF